MEYRMSSKKMMKELKAQKINTWFDLGLFIDKFKEEKPLPVVEVKENYDSYKKNLKKSGIAFITFYYSVDGVTIEIEKYAKLFKNIIGDTDIHYIAGKFYPNSYKLIDPSYKNFEIEEMQSFDDWPLYKDFYINKLQRGSQKYNELIIKFWKQTLKICKKLGDYIESNNIRLLYLINTNSNPGNVALALANVIVSEFMGIPVINNNHDFYWEGGNKKTDIKQKGLKPGPRDFFFNNADVGEFFSQIEVLFPWESRTWLNVNINEGQTTHLIRQNGHNPANVLEIGTAVDLREYQNIEKRAKINAFVQFEQIFSRYKKTLIGYAADDVIKNQLVDKENPKPILIGSKTKSLSKFLAENIVFLQPTRIISRKRIEQGFRLIEKLLQTELFSKKFNESKKLKLTLLITGPIPMGQYKYFEQLIKRYAEILNNIDEKFKDKIHLGFFFSELDRDSFKKRFERPIGIPDLYNISSLILLPSETEGRGLPIIEASAAGVPIFCSRYYPEEVYSRVIGEHLPEEDRLKVVEFDGIHINKGHLEDITRRVFFPHKFTKETEHNKRAVRKRYSLESLGKNMDKILNRLFDQMHPNDIYLKNIGYLIKEYREKVKFSNEDLKAIINDKNREYLPGYGRLAFMLTLKSLIDPSFFRVEQQNVKGMAMNYAFDLIRKYDENHDLSEKTLNRFFNAVDNIFYYKDGEFDIRHDHSISYRHRNNNYYPYQDFTIQELTGVINILYSEIIKPEKSFEVSQQTHFFTDWNLALSQLTSSEYIAIDDRDILVRKLKSNVPIAYFPGKYIKYELEFFALQSVRYRLKLKIEQDLTEDVLKKNFKKIQPIYIFAQESKHDRWAAAEDVIEYINNGNDNELKLLYDYQILKVIKTKQYCVGIHFPQMGELALSVLRDIMENKGYIISNRRSAVMMTDIVNIDRFHIGNIHYEMASNIMGIPTGAGYIQYVPAGVRATLAYPTPIQTAKDFHDVIKSNLYKDLCKKHGEEKINDIIRKDAENNGSPIKMVLENIKQSDKKDNEVEYKFVSGKYEDNNPWNGAFAKTNKVKGKKWEFSIESSVKKTKTVTNFVKEFEKKSKIKSQIAWNGGYILNPELVGKLGLSESYIGSPLGLLVSDEKILSLPLFNKPAIIIYKNGKIDIQRVNTRDGFTINKKIKLTSENYNIKKPDNKTIAFYDLMFNKDSIPAKDRAIVRLAGNTIKEIIKTKKDDRIKIIPVGITLSFPVNMLPKDWDTGIELNLELNEYKDIKHAVEAGPMLVDNNKQCIDMKFEGWKTDFSIMTQAARLDYLDMRGPKIAVGIDKEGNLAVLTINGRIRESVGATHIDMAEIMKDFGMEKAMGFDPGGSSTLVVNGQALNISPYNQDYEENNFAMKPQPRAVANSVIGFLK